MLPYQHVLMVVHRSPWQQQRQQQQSQDHPRWAVHRVNSPSWSRDDGGALQDNHYGDVGIIRNQA